MPGLDTPAALRGALSELFAPAAGHMAVGLAVSGGADSLALLLLARQWAAGLARPPRLFVYSVDHGLRPGAAAEVAFVLGVASGLGVAGRALRWAGDRPETGVQAAARQARYRLIGAAMATDGVTLLMTGHHRDDQAETVLMRLAHGSGLGGLRGMDARTDVEGVAVLRPLLDVPSDALRQLVGEAGLEPMVDPSNADPHYERVRWRKALPVLAAEGLGGAELGVFARRAGEADAALAQWADAAFAAQVAIDPLGAASLSGAGLRALPRAVAVKLLARLLELAGGGQRPHALAQVERLHDALLAKAPFAATTLFGSSVRRRGATVWFSREAGRRPVAEATIAPAGMLLWDRRFRIRNRSAGALGVRNAGALSRDGAERLLGRSLVAPAAAIRSAPLVSRADGTPVALGCHRLEMGVEIEFVGDTTGLWHS